MSSMDACEYSLFLGQTCHEVEVWVTILYGQISYGSGLDNLVFGVVPGSTVHCQALSYGASKGVTIDSNTHYVFLIFLKKILCIIYI